MAKYRRPGGRTGNGMLPGLGDFSRYGHRDWRRRGVGESMPPPPAGLIVEVGSGSVVENCMSRSLFQRGEPRDLPKTRSFREVGVTRKMAAYERLALSRDSRGLIREPERLSL